MPSPFPGMDPWLERPAVFGDVHSSLIYLLREAINAKLPRGYLATTTHLVWVDAELRREPDVGLYGPDRSPAGSSSDEPYAEQGMVCVAADPIAEPWEQPYLEIQSDEGERLVTAIEILSLSNKKTGDAGRTAYRQKQEEFRIGGVNLVEIDLLRGGAHTTAISHARLRSIAPHYDYHVCITVIGDPTVHQVKAFRLADRLPSIVIPLDPGVPKVIVDLQPLLDRAYDTGLYSILAKYGTKTPEPPLTPEQQAWAEGILGSLQPTPTPRPPA